MKYGFTAYEAQALGPHIVLKEERKDYTELGIWTIVLVVGGVLLVNAFLLPMTEAHADTKVLTDREQDALYCQYAAHGMPVHGATASQLETYCLTHG